jgi:hypothetical protein
MGGVGVVRVSFIVGPVVLSASEAFTRLSLRQVTGTPTGVDGAIVPFGGPEGVAVDGADDLCRKKCETQAHKQYPTKQKAKTTTTHTRHAR